MSLDPFAISEKLQDPKARDNFEGIQYVLNQLIVAYNNGVTKNFNTSASYAVTVTNGIITSVT